jgi:hypothetical protein
MKDEVFLLM